MVCDYNSYTENCRRFPNTSEHKIAYFTDPHIFLPEAKFLRPLNMIKLLHTYLTVITMTIINASNAHAELIILASPTNKDPYYRTVEDKIFDFHIAYAKQIIEKDDLLILTDKHRYNDYANILGKDKVAIAPMLDIWMRDFGFSNTTNPIMFRYTSAAQGTGINGQKDADTTQKILTNLVESTGLSFTKSNLLNDGGNFVDDYAGNVVISKKFLRDNKLSENSARKKLTAFDGITNVAFIEADEQGGLEHADGIVSFVDKNTLIVNAYPEDPEYAKQLKADLKRGLPNVIIHEIIAPYDDSTIYDEQFGSACGLYTNALVTPERIYFPQFGIPEDEIALTQLKAATTREIIPVFSQQICHMGGGVRCMSWQLRGKNANKMLKNFLIK